jgi:hypothetical protein
MDREPARNWRARGWVMVAAGLFLIVLIAAIALIMAPAIARPGVAVGGTTFTGTREQAQILLGVLGLVALFGALCVASGAHMIATGRRSSAGVRIIYALFLALVAVGWAVRIGLV